MSSRGLNSNAQQSDKYIVITQIRSFGQQKGVCECFVSKYSLSQRAIFLRSPSFCHSQVVLSCIFYYTHFENVLYLLTEFEY